MDAIPQPSCTLAPVHQGTSAPGKPAAKQGDAVVRTDTHILMCAFAGRTGGDADADALCGQLDVDGGLAADVVCEGVPLVTEGSTATNSRPTCRRLDRFRKPPSNRATVQTPRERGAGSGERNEATAKGGWKHPPFASAR